MQTRRRLRLDDRQSVMEPEAVFLVHLHSTLQQARMQVEDVAGVSFASRRATQGQRHLTVSNSLLGQVVIGDKHVAAEVLGASGLAVFAVIDEVLTHCSTSHRCDVLQRSRVGGGGGRR